MCQANYSNRYYSQKEMKHFRTHILGLMSQMTQKNQTRKKVKLY